MTSPSSSPLGRDGRPPESGGGFPGLAFLIVNGLLLAFTHRDLLTIRLHHGAAVELESWFFVADESSPALVVLMAGWLLVRRWGRLRGLTPATSAASLVGGLTAAAASAFVVGWSIFTASADLLAVSLALAGIGCAAILRGGAGVRLVMLPVLLLGFAVKIPGPLLNELAFRLQLLTTDYTGLLMYGMGMPALISGEQIIRATARFAVIENCSGLRSMETLSMLAILMVDLFHRRGLHAVVLVAVAPFVAFFVNGFRVILLVVNPHSEVAAIHNLQGIVMLLGGLLLLYGIDALLCRFTLGGKVPRSRRPDGPPQSAASPVLGRGYLRPAIVTVAIAFGAAASVAVPIYGTASPTFASIHLALPRSLDGWEGSDLPTEDVFLGTIAMRQSLFRRYTGPDGERVKLYVGLGNHSRDTRGPFSPKTALPGSGWVVEEEQDFAGPAAGPLQRVVRSRGQRRLLRHWTEGDEGFAVEVVRTALGLDRSPWSRQRDSIVVRISTALDAVDPEARGKAEARLQRFQDVLRDPLDELDRALLRKRFS